MGTIENYRSTNWNAMLYPEDDTHVKALDLIKAKYDYAYILHDKDLDEDGVLKKAHWHVVFYTGKNTKYRNPTAKGLGLAPNYIEKCESKDKSLEYLIHYNNPEKFQYTLDEVSGTMVTRLNELVNGDNKSEGEKIVELIDYIQSYDGFLTITEFARYCATQGYWAEFRRSGAIICKVIEEHNFNYNRELLAETFQN